MIVRGLEVGLLWEKPAHKRWMNKNTTPTSHSTKLNVAATAGAETQTFSTTILSQRRCCSPAPHAHQSQVSPTSCTFDTRNNHRPTAPPAAAVTHAPTCAFSSRRCIAAGPATSTARELGVRTPHRGCCHAAARLTGAQRPTRSSCQPGAAAAPPPQQPPPHLSLSVDQQRPSILMARYEDHLSFEEPHSMMQGPAGSNSSSKLVRLGLVAPHVCGRAAACSLLP